MASVKRRTPLLKVEALSADSARFISDLQHETDRGVALAGAAFIDDALRALISAAFLDDVKMTDRLLGADRPLCTLSARIDIAYAMGLIGTDMRKQANILREIRNSFAHEHRPADFTGPELKSAIDQLQAFLKPLKYLENAGPRSVVIMAIVMLTNHLLLRALSTQHASPGADFQFAGRFIAVARDRG